MFWKRKVVSSKLRFEPIILPPPPPKKEFETMLEILRDAEKFDNANEIDVRNNTLQNLVDYINEFRQTNTAMKDKTKIYVDLSKCSEEQIKAIPQILEKAGEKLSNNFKNGIKNNFEYLKFRFDNGINAWCVSGFKGVRTELTYHEFIKLFEGGDGENNTYSFSYLSCGKTLTVHIEAKNFNKAMIEFATNYHDIEWLYHAKIL